MADHPHAAEVQLSFREGVSLELGQMGKPILLQWQHRGKTAGVEMDTVTPGLLSAFQKLAGGGATEEELVRLTREADGFLAIQRLYIYLQKFEQALLICRTVSVDEALSFTLVPNSPYYNFQTSDIAPEQLYRLSRFAYWHHEEGRMILESPLGYAQIILKGSQAAALIAKLTQPMSYRGLSAEEPYLSPGITAALFMLLLNASLLSEVDNERWPREDQNDALRQWSFHDLLFHAQTRFGRSLGGFGRTYPFLRKVQPLPVVKRHTLDRAICLYRPDIAKLQAVDVPFTSVLEGRRSQRTYGRKPITDRQLGEFLYRVARVKECFEEQPQEQMDGEPSGTYPLSKRPYPSGGATYPLEVYITVDRCENIAAGFYHYCPLEHKLYPMSEWNQSVEQLMKRGRPDPSAANNPQVLITLAARFQRISWKYEAIPYALLLKECGVLSMSMHLVTTAMGLAGCIVGLGDSDLFAKLARTDYYAETCIGEFALGSSPDS